jgi:hypothetical protein
MTHCKATRRAIQDGGPLNSSYHMIIYVLALSLYVCTAGSSRLLLQGRSGRVLALALARVYHLQWTRLVVRATYVLCVAYPL